jgi:hypothetical protein
MGTANNELVRTLHGARHHAIELVAVLRGPHRRDPDTADAVAELARLARASGQADARILAAMKRAQSAEERIAEWHARAAEAERQLDEARSLLDTKRARAGLALGRVADRLRART